MKKSVEILGLPVISITEGRELGMSKTLLIDAKNGTVAAVTIEDEDWYRGVKLIPYESVIAIGDDAVTVTNSENILSLSDAGDYEALLDENIRVIGTKAITKSGTIQGNISELFIGDDGKIEKCEITAPDGTTTEVTCDQISIFGKQVTVIDPNGEKKNKPVTPKAPEAAEAPKAAPAPKAPEAPKAEAPAPKAEPEKAPEAPKAAPAVKEEPKKEAPKAAPAAPAAPAPKAEPKKEAPKAAPAAPAAPAADTAKQAAADKATEERHRRFLLGKKATRDIKMDNGIVIVQAGQDITEEVLQKAKLANKFIELSMNVR
ncbi:PRC-barrel domain-containing protein [Selenomonas sp. ND2010]|uniref:PRC-barrel domain-containing protein n=1 Tax=Selenomonas sp. ND2010 TaxID=1410618 RepID=UPI00051AB827|nr:PRC-barrel domain-containing protein [Selenomonas sp. ND2010]